MINSKAERTSRFIIEVTAPIFNKKGYSATSMSDITKAAGITKGAVYGNFKNKEALALEAFNYNVKYILDKINTILREIDSPLARLYAITNFYRNYYKHHIDFGGCPIINVGVDANHTNPKLYKRVRSVIEKIQTGISKTIQKGIDAAEIKSTIDPDVYAGRIFSLAEGAVFTSVLLKDEKYLLDVMNHIDMMIQSEMKTS